MKPTTFIKNRKKHIANIYNECIEGYICLFVWEKICINSINDNTCETKNLRELERCLEDETNRILL
jgi:hypothetical protein